MKYLLTIISCLLALNLTAQEVVVEYPYNPDFENDGNVGVEDLMQLLASFGMGFDVDEITIDELTLSDWISLFNTALIEQQAIIDSLSLYQDSNLALWDSINSFQEDLSNLNLSGAEPSVLLLSAEDNLEMDTPIVELPTTHDVVIIENHIPGFGGSHLLLQLQSGEQGDAAKRLKVCLTANPQWNQTPSVSISIYDTADGSPFTAQPFNTPIPLTTGNSCKNLIRLSGWWFPED